MKFGIIGAMDVEVATLKKNMQIMRTSTKASMEFCEGMIGDTAVVVVKCGIAKVNAGICVQILVDDFAVTHIINTGVAGSLDARINIGDIVISTDACYHDVDATVFGYRKGEVPQMGLREFPADEWLRTRVQASCRIADPDLAVFEGRICSGDQFIADSAVKEAIRKEHNGLCTEMEGAAIAHAAYLNNIPFLIIRAISDKADDSASMDYPAFEKMAIANSVTLILEMAGNL